MAAPVQRYSMKWNQAILGFLKTLEPPAKLPRGIDVLYPFADPDVEKVVTQFYKRYFDDDHQRTMMIGINPGRYGAGVTGIPFTDPIRLTDVCGIKHNWVRKPELSSIFFYEMIEAFGSVASFYSQVYNTSVSPLGYVRRGKNLNYYEEPKLEKMVLPFIVNSMNRQMEFNLNREVCFCVGEGQNFKFFDALNKQYGWFEKVVPLPHPRYVMQYKRYEIDQYIAQYIDALEAHGIQCRISS